MPSRNDAAEDRACLSDSARHVSLAVLTLIALLIHGYHPYAEDGGIYAAGLEYRLNRSLFPHDAAFADAHHAFSLFDPFLVLLVRGSHLPLPWLLLIAHLACLWLLLYAAWHLGQLCFRSWHSGLFAAATFAVSCTVPVAGTSLLLMEPYLTTRSFSTPLSLLAIAFLMRAGDASQYFKKSGWPTLQAAVCVVGAALMHSLMACYALAVMIGWLIASHSMRRARWMGWLGLLASACAVAWALRATAATESPAMLAADLSRSYWFLSEWHWYEWLGLAGPLIVFTPLLRAKDSPLPQSIVALCQACLGVGAIAILIALLFAGEGSSTHLVASLQPLRAFLLPYAVMVSILGAWLGKHAATRSLDPRVTHRFHRPAAQSIVVLACVAGIMLWTQRHGSASSRHLELPGRSLSGPWQQAFVWARIHTYTDALFAMDAYYITLPGEDAQVFRAVAQRSALCDFSKDGGMTAIHPTLAEKWQKESTAQKNLSSLRDKDRDERLRPFGATWMLLQSTAVTAHDCPYDNGTVKICSL